MLVRVLALLGLASATNQITCPSSEWVRGPSGDRCFLHTERTRTFEECQKSVCGPAGGTLACVREEEAEWLTEQFFSDGDEDASRARDARLLPRRRRRRARETRAERLFRRWTISRDESGARAHDALHRRGDANRAGRGVLVR